VAIKDGSGIPAKSLKTGKNQSVTHHNVSQQVRVPKTYFQELLMSKRQKFSPEELHARLIVTIGIILAIVFAGSVFALLYALLFITQPLGEQAPNDAAFIDLVSTLCVFLTGSLAGVLAGNGLKSKPKEPQVEVTK
jgi:polyferredoxin